MFDYIQEKESTVVVDWTMLTKATWIIKGGHPCCLIGKQ